MPASKTVNSISRGVEVLRCLSHGTDRISDLCHQLNLSKGTVHRLLKTLEMSEFVRQDPVSRRYFLGPLFLQLASRTMTVHRNLIINAWESMNHLRQLSKETVVLHIRIGLERLCLEELESLEDIKYIAGRGAVAPIHTGSAGKVLLAQLGEDELELVLKNLRLLPLGPNTITDKMTLRKELENVRKRGYATSTGERLEGASSISVPIGNYVYPAALSILGPENRFKPKMMDILEALLADAAIISRKLSDARC